MELEDARAPKGYPAVSLTLFDRPVHLALLTPKSPIRRFFHFALGFLRVSGGDAMFSAWKIPEG
jgi:hypothetical protein